MPKPKCCVSVGSGTKNDNLPSEMTIAKRLLREVGTNSNENDSDTLRLHRTRSCYKLKVFNYDREMNILKKPVDGEPNSPKSELNKKDASNTMPWKNVQQKLISQGSSELAQFPFENEDMLKIRQLCERLNCPQINFQIEKLTSAQDQLMRIQHRELFDRIFGSDFLCFRASKIKPMGAKKVQQQYFYEAELELGEEEGLICFGSEGEVMDLLPENEWHGFFKGYEVLSETNEFSLNDIKKCIEIGEMDTVENLEVYLRAGVRCFMIDLFKGNHHRNQSLVVRFRQSELNVAKELGFPVTSTLFARLSPRLQYTGYLDSCELFPKLCKNECLTLTTDRFWANRCTRRRIFVNARYLLPDTHRCDIILIGTEIQLVVNRVMDDALRCRVLCGGRLRSRMPVLFNQRCPRFRLSFCELEDITFVKEVGISVVVSDMLGTQSYFENLRNSLKLLKCDHLRLFARIVLNNIDDDETNFDWAKDAYDGFVGELSQFRDGCGGDGNIIDTEELSTRILFINPHMRKLIESAHRSRKPFIFDPTPLIDDQYIMDPESYRVVLYHPDKYLFHSDHVNKMTTFYMLTNALAAPMPEAELHKLIPYCDESHTGSDTLALATVAASFEMQASCIFVLGLTGRMVTKIACYRPKATIYFISNLKSVTNYISIYHNVVMLYYHNKTTEHLYQKSVFKQFLFGLSYALTLKALKDGDQVMFVYGQKPGQLFPDKYVAYKFDTKNFIRDLTRTLF